MGLILGENIQGYIVLRRIFLYNGHYKREPGSNDMSGTMEALLDIKIEHTRSHLISYYKQRFCSLAKLRRIDPKVEEVH